MRRPNKEIDAWLQAWVDNESEEGVAAGARKVLTYIWELEAELAKEKEDSMETKSVDQACLDLAARFMMDTKYGPGVAEPLIQSLAEAIQEAIEDWFSGREDS